jgi:CRISPR-associated endoribonuclease Cas6
MNELIEYPHLGEFWLGLHPRDACHFKASPGRSIHAALLRRLELTDPDLSQALHDAIQGASASDHPWTVSPLIGQMDKDGDSLMAVPGRHYRVRITALAPRVLEALAAAFDPKSPLGGGPLLLEHVPFQVIPESSHWENLATYPSLLTAARPQRRITLRFYSPAGFRTRHNYGPVPPPRLCIEGWLRKWNAFASVVIPEEELLVYVEDDITVVNADLRSATVWNGRYSVNGVVGTVAWESEESSPYLLRLVNALADYAVYCGTGRLTAQGMGQTERVDT